jgi:hypothetical protein
VSTDHDLHVIVLNHPGPAALSHGDPFLRMVDHPIHRRGNSRDVAGADD